jgi:predicted acylesterase/phospholipase RssA
MNRENSDKPKQLEEIISEEQKVTNGKRQHYHPEDQGGPSFGIALSGGGIRSATLNLGVLEVLNACRILRRADYLSSVSGGGYIAGYVHSHLHKDGPKAYDQMFDNSEIERLKQYGYYLTPGETWLDRFWNRVRMSGALTVSFLLNWIWVLALAATLIFGLKYLVTLSAYAWQLGYLYWDTIKFILLGAFAILAYYFFGHGLRRLRQKKSNPLSYLAGFLLLVLGLWAGFYWDSIKFILLGAMVILTYYFFGHGLRRLRPVQLWNSDHLYYVAGFFLLLLGLWTGFYLAEKMQLPEVKQVNQVLAWLSFGYLHLPGQAWQPDASGGAGLFISLIILLVTGFFANPNLLTLHRFYRDRISKAFLWATGTGDEGLTLAEMVPNGYWGPYPLINTCLNLFNSNDDSFPGTKGSDYFLLSPRYCGSRTLDYEKTDSPLYHSMTLATAVAVSGAAINPHMGTQSNRVVALLLTLLNLRLGYWALKPKASPYFCWLTWWPYYHILELLSLNDTSRRRVNLSDGGHIENLGVYELLRRGCRLIIAVDATADPNYTFKDLKNLVIRARNELGLKIVFRQDPETFIRPLPSQGFSQAQFVTADIIDLDGKEAGKLYEEPGLLIYLKASMLAPGRVQQTRKDKSYDYKTYHPEFPHESTANQFFDEYQWEAYYQLGRFMAADLLQIPIKADEPTADGGCKINSIDELQKKFANLADDDALTDRLRSWDVKFQKKESHP